MKKISTLILLSLSAMFIFSCQKAESPVTDPSEGTITTLTVAAPGSDVDTKVSFEDEATGMKLTWKENDVITIYSADGNTKAGNYQCTAVDESGNATFSKEESATALVSGTTYQAVYPASAETTITARNTAMATTLAAQTQSANDLTHLDDYLFMKSASFVAGTENLAFTYEVSTYVLTFPWHNDSEGANKATAVELRDGEKSYKLTTSAEGGFADNKAYFMILPNDVDAERKLVFSVYNSTTHRAFGVNSTKNFTHSKTYRGNISKYTKYTENSVDRGFATAVDGVLWAPVNCGYEPVNGDYKGYPYGKLYQWGRKDGQGYKYDSYEDATEPTVVEGLPSTPYLTNAEANSFYKKKWNNTTAPDGTWGTSAPWDTKNTKNDPCPEGWRVPTSAELEVLYAHSSEGTWDDSTNEGRWFAGTAAVVENKSNAVFFPAAGCRFSSSGNARNRGSVGNYWSSTPSFAIAYQLHFHSGAAEVGSGFRASGFSVRCVQE